MFRLYFRKLFGGGYEILWGENWELLKKLKKIKKLLFDFILIMVGIVAPLFAQMYTTEVATKHCLLPYPLLHTMPFTSLWPFVSHVDIIMIELILWSNWPNVQRRLSNMLS